MMDFHVVLPSNASPRVYPDNKTSNFKIQLSERVDLHGDWEVALLEIHYPNTVQHVTEGENTITVSYVDGDEDVFHVQPGQYRNANPIFLELNEILSPKFTSPSSEKKSTIVEVTKDDYIVIHPFENVRDAKYTFSPKLSLQLGLIHPGPYSSEKHLYGTYPIDMTLGAPPQLYIYLDVIQDQIVGHTRAPLLRTIPVDTRSTFGSMTTYMCDPPIYFQLKTKSFDTLEVNIRTHAGAFMPFDHGTSTLLCHFRQRP